FYLGFCRFHIPHPTWLLCLAHTLSALLLTKKNVLSLAGGKGLEVVIFERISTAIDYFHTDTARSSFLANRRLLTSISTPESSGGAFPSNLLSAKPVVASEGTIEYCELRQQMENSKKLLLGLNVYSILQHDTLVMSRAAVKLLSGCTLQLNVELVSSCLHA
ncbi:Ribosomal protein L4/L1 family, partial [Prunus dulcis]